MRSAFMLVAVALWSSAAAAAQKSDLVPLTDDDRQAVIAGVKASLKDPGSAEFRWLPARREDGVYCGMVNARNSLGGYTGFTPFSVLILDLKNPPERKALVVGMGNGSASSPQTQAVVMSCARNGFEVRLAR